VKNLLHSVAITLQFAPHPEEGESFRLSHQQLRAYSDEMILLIDSMRDIWMHTQGRGNFRRVSTSFFESLVEAVMQARRVAELREIDVSYQTGKHPVFVSMDDSRLVRVLFGVLLHLIEISHSGQQIDVAVARENNQAVVRFMAPALQELSGPDERSLQWPTPRETDQPRISKRIRIPLAKSLVELHDGVLSLEPTEGQSRGLVIRLPLAGELPAGPGGNHGPQRQKRRVLVVDDNVDCARTIATYLRLLGHDVDTRYDGESALQAAEATAPDVIVLDLGLPKLDGYQLASRLREKDQFAHTKLIAVSGYGFDEDQARSRQAGINHHLTKPIDNSELLDLIEKGAD
jgi:CheY-like chemotaxis protein